MVAIASENVCMAICAGWHELGSIRIVQVIQHHHTRVLRSPQLVELVVVALTQVEERLPRFEVLVLLDIVNVFGVVLQLGRNVFASHNEHRRRQYRLRRCHRSRCFSGCCYFCRCGRGRRVSLLLRCCRTIDHLHRRTVHATALRFHHAICSLTCTSTSTSSARRTGGGGL